MDTPSDQGPRRTIRLVCSGAAVLIVGLLLVLLVARPGGGDAGKASDADTSAQKLPDNPSSEFTPGSLKTVPVEEVTPAKPVDFDEKATLGPGITSTLTGLRAVKGTARGPGEIAGPALQVKVTVANASDEAINLGRAVVEVTYGKKRTPGVQLSGPGAAPFPPTLKAGESAEGTYVFGVPKGARGRVQITIAYTAGQPPAVFEGDATAGAVR